MQNINKLFRPIILFSTIIMTACTVNIQTDWSNGSIEALDSETADLADVKTDIVELIDQVGKEDVLVVFDIDNTLLAMEQGLGADQWYEWQKELGKDDRCNPDSVGNRFAVQGALYFVSAMRNTQADGPEQVKAIQDLGAPVIALTSRGMEFELQTFRELRRSGYSFNYTAIGPAGGYEKPFIPVKDGRFSLYQDGVFLTAGQHKGQMLLSLLKKTGTPMPDAIVVTDDKQKNLDAIKETFAPLEVPVHAWRYTAEDENVRSFDPELANDQWKSIEDALRQIQTVIGPDNYDLSTAGLPADCR